MTRDELEEYFCRANQESWRKLKQSKEYKWDSIVGNKLIEKIYSETRDWDVTLGDMGAPGPASDEEKKDMLESDLPKLERLLAKASSDTAIMETPLFVEIVKRGEETLKNAKELYTILKAEV